MTSAAVPLAEQPTLGLMIQWLRGVSEPQTPGDRELDDDDLIFARAALATLQQHERAMAALRDEALVERIVRADFLIWSVYGGYNQETKEREWERIKRIELGAFQRRLASLLAALDGAANTAGDAATTEEDKQNHGDEDRC